MTLLEGRPSATTAAMTAFCAASIDGPDGLRLWIDGNGKITAGNGTLDKPKPNAFSLMHIKDCPGSTPTCQTTCYVHSLEKFAPDTYALYRHNSETIRVILSDTALSDAWAKHVGAWIAENCPGGFRWHVSGDVFSTEYAAWIVNVCRHSPAIQHWIYTRSYEMISPFADYRANLAVNISSDRDNESVARLVADAFGWRVSYDTR